MTQPTYTCHTRGPFIKYTITIIEILLRQTMNYYERNNYLGIPTSYDGSNSVTFRSTQNMGHVCNNTSPFIHSDRQSQVQTPTIFSHQQQHHTTNENLNTSFSSLKRARNTDEDDDDEMFVSSSKFYDNHLDNNSNNNNNNNNGWTHQHKRSRSFQHEQKRQQQMQLQQMQQQQQLQTTWTSTNKRTRGFEDSQQNQHYQQNNKRERRIVNVGNRNSGNNTSIFDNAQDRMEIGSFRVSTPEVLRRR